jgi:hypothetical protein
MSRKDVARIAKEQRRENRRMKAPTEQQLNDAMHVIRLDYLSDVWGIALDLADRISNGDIGDSESFGDALHEEVDDSQRVIYTFNAKLGLLATENEDAYEEEFGEKPDSPEKAIFAALEADVLRTLDAWGIDVNDDETFEGAPPRARRR